MFKSKCVSVFALLALSALAMASYASPHTWHTVSTTDGTWNAKLQMINENGFFETRDGSALSTFTIQPGLSQDYGFGFADGSDFDIAYTLTLTQQENRSSLHFSSKACVYVITASGPAKPDIRASSFNGAKCDWQVVSGTGENFIVS